MDKEKSDALNKAIKASFGEKFEIARKNAGFSRAKLGEVIGVSGKTIQSWENGRTWPENMSLIPIIEKILGIFIPKILGETVREEVAKTTKSESPKPPVETPEEPEVEEAPVEEKAEEKKVIRRAASVSSSEDSDENPEEQEEIDEV
jgi:transcriptional regulator with XRE-family HTH domain